MKLKFKQQAYQTEAAIATAIADIKNPSEKSSGKLLSSPFPHPTGGLMYSGMIIILYLVSVAFGAHFPFPQNKAYQYGITTSSIDSTAIQSLYSEWKRSFYTQKDSLAFIKWDNPKEAVSEGIAYGMLIMVYMDNTLNDTRGSFDKLWNYYTKFANENGLMNWHIYAWDSIVDGGAATDADLDAALALCMAYRQWDDSTYLAGARNLIRSIRRFEVDSTHHLKPGDEWNTAKNISYLSFAALRLFGQVDQDDAYTPDVKAFWQEVTDSSYALALRAQHQKTGLVPDWCGTDGKPKDPENGLTKPYDQFDYDAVRTPWRMAWAYYWFGDSLAKKFNSKIAQWASQFESPGEVSNACPMSGTGAGTFAVHPFCAAWTFCGTVDSSYINWVDTGVSDWMEDIRVGGAIDNYYPGTLLLLNTLLISGNMPNYAEGYSFNGSKKIKTVRSKKPAGVLLQYAIHNGCLTLLMDKEITAGSIQIFDPKGRRCASQDISSRAGRVTLSLNELKLLDNIYCVHLRGNGQSTTIKVPLCR